MVLNSGMLSEQQEKDKLKFELIGMDYFKTPDGRQLYELDLQELQQIYENQKCRKRAGKNND